MEFTQPTKNRYSVFLEGFDDDWRAVTYQNNISYSNLPPGDYILKIKGANNDFVWNNDPTILNITIRAPLWRSSYAFAFYIIAFIFLLQAVINFRVRYYRRAYQSLKEKAVIGLVKRIFHLYLITSLLISARGATKSFSVMKLLKRYRSL